MHDSPSGQASKPAVAAMIGAVGFCVLGALLAHVFDPAARGPFAAAGSELFSSFLWAAFLIPVYLFVAAALLLVNGVRARWLAALTFSILPFLTLSALLRLVLPGGGAPLTDLLSEAFGRTAAALVLGLALGIEVSVLIALASRRERRADGAERTRATSPGAEAPGAVDDPAGASWEEEPPKPPGESELLSAAAVMVRLLEVPLPHANANGVGATGTVRVLEPEPAEESPAETGIVNGGFPVPVEEVELAEEAAEDAVGEAELARLSPEQESDEEAGAAPDLQAELGAPETDELAPEPDAAEVVLSDDEVRVVDAAVVEAEEPEEAAEEGAQDTPEETESAIPVEPEARVTPVDEEEPEPRPRARRRQGYSFPIEGILKEYADGAYWEIDAATQRAAEVLKDTLEEFSISAEVTGIRKGPVITMFEVLPAPGVKISKIANLADNIALRLAASRVRIVAPIPGKHAVGIEVPNRERFIVGFREMVSLPEFQNSRFRLPVVLGKGISGEAKIIDLTQTPHLLIAGATGAGKSVCVNALIASILYRRSPEEAKLILVDPKIVELKYYNDIPHLLTPVITDTKRAYQALQYCICEMERRYSLLDAFGVRDIASYNKKVETGKTTALRIPYIVFVIDEFADLMAQSGKEMESTVARLAAMSRAVGIHLVLATQRPSVDVITGLIKANIPSRIAFMVASKFDSRIIIDGVGAEKLLGKGDMLFTASWDPLPQRLQGAFLSEEEVEAVANHARTLGEPEYIDDEMFIDEDDDFVLQSGEDDPMMDDALQIVLSAGKASASYLQRRLKIGYNRAARLVEEMEQRGIVGPSQGSKPRDILHVPDRAR